MRIFRHPHRSGTDGMRRLTACANSTGNCRGLAAGNADRCSEGCAMTWAQRAARNILPLSRERSDLAAALREWRYQGGFRDLEAPDADCELSDHPDIRYQFEIRNRYTNARLQIGSECINRFGISATGED